LPFSRGSLVDGLDEGIQGRNVKRLGQQYVSARHKPRPVRHLPTQSLPSWTLASIFKKRSQPHLRSIRSVPSPRWRRLHQLHAERIAPVDEVGRRRRPHRSPGPVVAQRRGDRDWHGDAFSDTRARKSSIVILHASNCICSGMKSMWGSAAWTSRQISDGMISQCLKPGSGWTASYAMLSTWSQRSRG